MNQLENAVMNLAMITLGVLFHYMLEISAERRSSGCRAVEANERRTVHEMISLNEMGQPTQGQGRKLDPSAATSPASHSSAPRSEPITSQDIAAGFCIIREREFSKYEFNDREREIARMMLDGMSNKQIASKTRLGESSVKYHITSIFKKTSLKNRKDFAHLIKKGMRSNQAQWSDKHEMRRELQMIMRALGK